VVAYWKAEVAYLEHCRNLRASWPAEAARAIVNLRASWPAEAARAIVSSGEPRWNASSSMCLTRQASRSSLSGRTRTRRPSALRHLISSSQNLQAYFTRRPLKKPALVVFCLMLAVSPCSAALCTP
jgi:hypothetical protein